MRFAAALLVLVLAGCAAGNLSSRHELPPEPPTRQSTAPPVSPPSLSSPAARAAAMPDATVGSGGLLPCETQSCRINCSSKVPARARPKWCTNFEEPVE